MIKSAIKSVTGHIILLLIIFTVAACGGGGSKSKTSSSTASQSGSGSAAPTATVLFPPENAFTEGSTILVKGTASDTDGTIASVAVNGIQATSTNGFATWSVNIPLQIGANTLAVAVTDNAGVKNKKTIQQKITHQTVQLHNPTAVVFDKKNNRALLLDPYDGISAAIVAVNLVTGTQTLVSNNSIAVSEINFKSPSAIAIDETRNRALVLDYNRLLAVDLTTGARSLVKIEDLPDAKEKLSMRDIAVDDTSSKLWILTSSDIIAVDSTTGISTALKDTISSNKPINIPYGESMQFDSINHRLVVTSTGQDYLGIIGIDINTGDRTVISNRDTPNAVNMFSFSTAVGIAVDSAHNQIFVADSHHKVIYQVNSVTGERKLLPTSSLNTQALIKWPLDMFVDSDKNRLIVLDAEVSSLIAVDLTTSKSSLITEIHTNPLGNPLYQSLALAYDSQSDKIFSANYASILSVDALNGDRAMFKERSVDRSRTYQGLAYDSTKNILYYEEGFDNAVEAIDLTSNKRSIISGVGIPDLVNNPINYTALELDESKNQLIVADGATAAIYRIDLSTGKRSIVSDNTTPTTSNPMSYPLGLDLDTVNHRVFVADFYSKSIYQIDLNSGERQLISGPSKPDTQIALISPRSVAYDASNNRLIVADSGLRALVQVDLATGQRSIISNDLIPNSTNAFSTPTWIQLDIVKNIAYVVDRGSDKFLSVNLSTGERTELFSVDSPEQFIMDTKNNRAIITAESPGAIYIYDFSTNKLSDYKIKPEFDTLKSMDIDQTNNRIIALDEDDQFIAIDKNDASTKPLYDGSAFDMPRDFAIDSQNQKLFVLDDENTLYSTDLNSGTTNLLIDFYRASRPKEINYVGDIAWSSSAKSVFAIGKDSESQTMVWKFNLSDKSLSVLFHDQTPGTQGSGALKIVIDESKNRALVVDGGHGSVAEISLTDSSHKVLSDLHTPNTFNPILEATSVTLDPKRNRLLISQDYAPGLISIDLDTGERVYISR